MSFCNMTEHVIQVKQC